MGGQFARRPAPEFISSTAIQGSLLANFSLLVAVVFDRAPQCSEKGSRGGNRVAWTSCFSLEGKIVN